jgi:phage tail sheath gpL-like
MALPVAVAPSVKSPGLALVVNLRAGAASPGTTGKKALIIAVRSAAGTITPNTQIVEGVAGEADVATFLGAGSPGHLAAKRLFEEYGIAAVDLVSPADPAGASAVGTITFAGGPPTSDRTANAFICGRQISVIWKAGETDTAGALKMQQAIAAQTNDLPVTATVMAGVITLTFKTTGTIGNDVRLRTTVIGGAGGTVTASGSTLAGGMGEESYTTAITTIVGKEYDIIVPCVGNTAATVASTTQQVGSIRSDINTRASGFTAKLQQAVVGVTGSLTAAKVGTDTHNFERMQYAHCLNGESLPCEFGGAEAGARLREETKDPAANRIELEYKAQLFGSSDISADEPTEAEVEDALTHGVTILKYNASKQLMPSRPITTYWKDAAGNPDDRVLDTSRVTGTDAVAKDLRVNLPREFKGAKLSKDLLPGQDEPPEGVVQEKDVKAFVDTRVRFFISRGVVRADKYADALANGTFIVKVDPTDSAQLDIVLPVTIFPPLAKISLVVQHKAA